MRLKALFVAAPLLALATLAFAQTVAAVTPPPDSLWDELLNSLVAMAAVAVPVLTAIGAKLLWSYSSLAKLLVTQTMIDRLNDGIIKFIRAEVEKLRQDHTPGVSAKAEAATAAVPATSAVRAEIVSAVQPKVEAAFKETLSHLGKAPGSSAVTDMIRGRMEEALKPPAAVAVPAVMARS